MEYIFDDIEYIECIGSFEDEYVYDIEMDDETHTFIANDILVHNSLYISFTPLMESIDYNGDEIKFILHLNAMFIKHMFNDMLEKYAKSYGVENLHDFELETINRSGLHLKKKHYINSVAWEDGAFYEPHHFMAKGVEIVRNSSPVFVREKIWEFIKYLFNNPNNLNIRNILRTVKNLKKEFMVADIEDISMSTSLSNYENKILDDQTSPKAVKGAHFSVKAAGLHNYLLNKNPEYKTKYDLLRGGKIKYYYCKHPLENVFGYMRSFHPSEITSSEGVEIDYDTQYDKCFLKIVNRFLIPLGIPPINKRLGVLNSLFSNITKDKTKKTKKQENDKKNKDDFGFFDI